MIARKICTEGKATIRVPTGKISADLPVFYNPVMRMNRDITLHVLAAWHRQKLRIADPLAGSGIRAIRMLKELRGTIAKLAVNDANPIACKNICENFRKSGLRKPTPSGKVRLSNDEASRFISLHGTFDYMDIDPFGSPNPFLDAAVQNLARGGMLALTATDTSALAGSHPAACKRKYWAVPLKNEFMHETGCRILIRKAQLIAAQYEKALIPVLSYADAHYARVFLLHIGGNAAVEKVLAQHQLLLWCWQCGGWRTGRENVGMCCGKAMQLAGPLWIGQLWDAAFLKPQPLSLSPESEKLLALLRAEAKLQTVGFYDLHKISKRHKVALKPIVVVQAALAAKGFKSCRTHFAGTAIRSDAGLEEVVRAVR